MLNRIFLTAAWLGCTLVAFATWNVVKDEVYVATGVVHAANPKSAAATAALVVVLVKACFLIPFWLIWKSRNISNITYNEEPLLPERKETQVGQSDEFAKTAISANAANDADKLEVIEPLDFQAMLLADLKRRCGNWAVMGALLTILSLTATFYLAGETLVVSFAISLFSAAIVAFVVYALVYNVKRLGS